MRAVAIDNVGWLMWDMIIESLHARIKNVGVFYLGKVSRHHLQEKEY